MRRSRSRDPKLERLSQVSLFAGCSKAELRRIGALTNEIEAPAGAVLIRKGEPGRECFVILEGSAKATIPGKKGKTMRAGECFGELALLDAAPRSATVTAETDMRLVVLSSREFWAVMDENPRVRRKVLAAVAERLRDAERVQPTH
ncbi:MAG: cyclic nucleotide-binding domain-containing protein [Solirubrobacterales bacterium]